MEGVAFVQFTAADVVRHSLVTRIVRAYASYEAGKSGEGDLFGRDRCRPATATNDDRRLWKYKLGDRRVQIGRASCRERVCTYVWISVVDRSIKKKNSNLKTDIRSQQT